MVFKNTLMVQQLSGKGEQLLALQEQLLQTQQQLLQTQQKLELIQQQVRRDCTCAPAVCRDAGITWALL